MLLSRVGSEQVLAAVQAGDIKLADKTVTVSAKALKSQGITVDTVKAAGLTVVDGAIEQPVQIPLALNAKGMAALCFGIVNPAPEDAEKGTVGVCDLFNYAVDLDIRSEVRQDIMGKLESPDKAIAKGVAGLVAIGMAEKEAASIVVTQMRKTGRIAADYAYKSAA